MMFPLEETTQSPLFGSRHQHDHRILYNILSGKERDALSNPLNLSSTAKNCQCEQRQGVSLRDPRVTCKAACSILGRTIHFMRSLPSFRQLPVRDQCLLLRHCWVHLFILGLAQENVLFDVTEASDSTILRQILIGPEIKKKARTPTLSGVNKLRSCLHQLRNLNLSPQEYAYLKGALLFNPAVQGLSSSLLVEGLQKEAQTALQNVVRLLHPEDSVFFSRILKAAAHVQAVSHRLVTVLFFKPVISNTNIMFLLTKLLFL